MSSALALYAKLLEDDSSSSLARLQDGTTRPIGLTRWLAAADATDEEALTGLAGPVLDVGCGPGRHLHALARKGIFGLGVDICPAAIDLARMTGAEAIVASIFDELPGEGSWRSALLLDGNVGIGGRPVRLLSRIRALLAPEAEILVELAPPDTASWAATMRLETPWGNSEWFPWAEVCVEDIESVSRLSGFAVLRTWARGGRWFSLLGTAKIGR